MSYVNVMVHAVWCTKGRVPFLTEAVRPRVIQHIRENARSKGIYIDCINGYTDHLHCLFGLNANMSVAKAMQLLKGESAYWINKNKICGPRRFAWADKYYAASVSEADRITVRNYIMNQETHHHKPTYAQSYEAFLAEIKMECQG